MRNENWYGRTVDDSDCESNYSVRKNVPAAEDAPLAYT